MADESNIVSDVMTTPEQVLAAGGVSKRRRGASRRSPSGQRRRAPTPEPPKDLPVDPDEEIDAESEISPTKPQVSPKKSQVSPTKPTTIKRITTTEKTLTTRRSHSSPGENRQSLTSSVITSSELIKEPPLPKPEDQTIITGDGSQSKTAIVKRKSTTEKTLVTKRSLSSPGEGRQSLPQSATTGDIKQEIVAPRRRRLSDDADKVIGDGTQVAMVKKSPLTWQPPVKTEDVVKVKKIVQEEKPVDSSLKNKAEVTVLKDQIESEQAAKKVEKTQTSEDHKKPEETVIPSPPEDKKVLESVEETKPETGDEKTPFICSKEDKKVKEAIWGPFFKEMLQEWRKFVAQHGEQWGKIISQRNRCIGALVVMTIYCGLGGLIFRFTEGAFEAFYKCGVKRVKRDFVDTLWHWSHNMREEDWKSHARNKLMELENQLHAAHEAGVTSYSGQRAWSFLNAVVYCLTVVTTIGKFN